MASEELKVPIHLKSNLNLKEAAAYSGIGEHSIRELIEMGNFSFRIGNKIMINRELFDRFIQEFCINN